MSANDRQTETAERNEWRETVRDIYDELVVRHGDRILAQTIVRMIESRHSAYFGAKDVKDAE